MRQSTGSVGKVWWCRVMHARVRCADMHQDVGLHMLSRLVLYMCICVLALLFRMRGCVVVLDVVVLVVVLMRLWVGGVLFY
jgi:hypothetical protein